MKSVSDFSLVGGSVDKILAVLGKNGLDTNMEGIMACAYVIHLICEEAGLSFRETLERLIAIQEEVEEERVQGGSNEAQRDAN